MSRWTVTRASPLATDLLDFCPGRPLEPLIFVGVCAPSEEMATYYNHTHADHAGKTLRIIVDARQEEGHYFYYWMRGTSGNWLGRSSHLTNWLFSDPEFEAAYDKHCKAEPHESYWRARQEAADARKVKSER